MEISSQEFHYFCLKLKRIHAESEGFVPKTFLTLYKGPFYFFCGMFLENTVNHEEKFGWIEVICGSMFSGKTEELIRRLKRAQFARQTVEIFKPTVDTRYAEERVVSHDENEIRCTPVPASANIRLLANQTNYESIHIYQNN